LRIVLSAFLVYVQNCKGMLWLGGRIHCENWEAKIKLIFGVLEKERIRAFSWPGCLLSGYGNAPFQSSLDLENAGVSGEFLVAVLK
jgi:hypothetical protein